MDHNSWVLFVCEYLVIQTFNVLSAVIGEDAALHKCILYKLCSEGNVIVISAIVFFPPLYVQGTLILVPVQFLHGDGMSDK